MIFWKDFQLDDSIGAFLILPEQRTDLKSIMDDARNRVLGSALKNQDKQMDYNVSPARMVGEIKSSKFENSKRHGGRSERSSSKKGNTIRSEK